MVTPCSVKPAVQHRVKFCSLTFSDCSTIVGHKVVPDNHLKVTPASELDKVAGCSDAN
jgi:hypothetical protein